MNELTIKWPVTIMSERTFDMDELLAGLPPESLAAVRLVEIEDAVVYSPDSIGVEFSVSYNPMIGFVGRHGVLFRYRDSSGWEIDGSDKIGAGDETFGDLVPALVRLVKALDPEFEWRGNS